MINILNKIIVNFTILLFLGACHSSEHKIIYIGKNITNLISKDISKIVPINKKESIKITPINKKSNKKTITLESLMKYSETKLYSKIGKGDFIKQEGKLKNIQYYFSECFLDIFLMQKDNDYYVNFLQIRSTKLNGYINKAKCLSEIAIKFKKV